MKKLVFVYNGDSGLVNGIMHYLHKRVSPETYPCQLCGIIYDGMSLNREWLAFVERLGIPSEYQHRDEYARRYGQTDLKWPAVLLHDGDRRLATVISTEEFAQVDSLSKLQDRLRRFVTDHVVALDALAQPS